MQRFSPPEMIHNQIGEAVPVQVASDIDVVNVREARWAEVGRYRDERPFDRRVGIEPVQAAGPVGDETITAVDRGDIDPPQVGTQRRVEFRHPAVDIEGVNTQVRVVALVAVERGHIGHRAAEEEPGDHAVTSLGAGGDLVLLEVEPRGAQLGADVLVAKRRASQE